MKTWPQKATHPLTLIGLILFFCLVPNVQAAGLLLATGDMSGQLKIKEHNVKVVINNGIAVTTVTQVFKNQENRMVEALYTFPIPKGATVSNFSMWIQGNEMTGEVVEKKRAKEIYESYKERRVDPGLLEQVNYKKFEMRIFPIAPLAEQKVSITYYQELEIDNDYISYVYPLETVTEKIYESKTTHKFSMSVDLLTEVPISFLKSFSHKDSFSINKINEKYYQASLEVKEGDLNQDVTLQCQLQRPKSGIDMITSRINGEDGYFYITLMSGDEDEKKAKGNDYVFILDVSGSMAEDKKLAFSSQTISSFVQLLDQNDRIEFISFNTTPTALFGQLTAMQDANIAKVQQNLRNLKALGGTHIESALQLAYRYKSSEKDLQIVVFSDGMDQSSYTNSLLQMMRNNSDNGGIKTFCVGVGNDIDKPFLQKIAVESGGLAAFISRNDDAEQIASMFYRKLTKPIAKNVNIKFEGCEAYDIYPKKIPDLYHGYPIRIYGRYKNPGTHNVKFTAEFNHRAFSKEISLDFPKKDEKNPEIERMWASKKIDSLVLEHGSDQVQKRDIKEIIRLGEAYSIVSEYTSFLVLENNEEYKRWNIERKNLLRVGRDNKAIADMRTEMENLRKDSVKNLQINKSNTNTEAVDTIDKTENNMIQKNVDYKKSNEKTNIDNNSNRTNTNNSNINKTNNRFNEDNSSTSDRSNNINLGGGAVNPVILLGALGALIYRRKQKKANLHK